MKQYAPRIILFLTLITITSCSHKKDIPEILQNKFGVLVISNNFVMPAVNLEENHLKEILVLLHNNFSAEEIKGYFQINDSTYNLYINNLFGEGLVKKTSDGNFVPTCMIIDAENKNQLKKTADSLGREMSLIAIDRLVKVKDVYKTISAFKNIPFEEASLFILGNVVHNHWQMPVIEEKFIKADAPHRGVNRYYLAIVEDNKTEKSQSFGLYTNIFQQIGNFIVGNYTSYVYEGDSIIAKKDLEKILKKEIPSVPILRMEDQKKINEIASIISPDLLNYLEKNRTFFVKLYLNSVYKEQTTFREWFVWYYQFMITQINKSLIENGYIPKTMRSECKFILSK